MFAPVIDYLLRFKNIAVKHFLHERKELLQEQGTPFEYSEVEFRLSTRLSKCNRRKLGAWNHLDYGGNSRGLRILPIFSPEAPILERHSDRRPYWRRHPICQWLAPPLHVTSGLLTTEDAETSVAAAAVDVDPLLDSADGSALTPFATGSDAVYNQRAQHRGRRGIFICVEQHGAQLAQMAGQLRRNAEHVRLRDRRGKALGTTFLTISRVVVVAIALLVMFFVIRFT
ncbi:hypothetical protein EDB83DRAFT_2518177 [Lactarius deliciosus]|nr:hypothetical protein EDB83DRAFT_2518177 [Lactarius deliciosus]